jgi:hypothetical protein
MNKTQITIIITGLIIGGAIVFSGNEKEVTPQVEETKVLETAKKEQKNIYMQGCIGDETFLFPFCECTYNSLIEEYGYEGFNNLSLEFQATRVFNEKTQDIIMSCVE